MMDDKPIKDIRVADVLADVTNVAEAATVPQTATLRQAVEAMIEDNATRKVYVVDEERRLIGTITLETLMRHSGYLLGVRKTGMTSFIRMLAEISDDKVKDVMTKPVKVSSDELLVNVTKLMVENHLNDLPVVDDKGRLVAELNGLYILKASMRYWN